MPYSAYRFLRHYEFESDEVKSRMPDGLMAALNKFYYGYDTANTANIYAMASFTKVISISQLMFGTDFPFGNAAADARALAECGFTASELRAIEYENALRLLPQLAS